MLMQGSSNAVLPLEISPAIEAPDRRWRDAMRWFTLAVASLAVAGLFALVLVVGRTPLVDSLLSNDPDFARRSLVVHVNLAMGVWFFATVAGLFCLLPGVRRIRTAPLAVTLAALGCLCFAIPTFLKSATPILSDYVPALHHWLFLLGLIIFAAGTVLNFIDPRILPAIPSRNEIPAEAQHGLRAAGITFLIAMLTISAAYISQRAGMNPFAWFERLFWGGGHILQIVNVMGLLVAWLILLREIARRTTVPRLLATAMFLLLLLPSLAGPWLVLGGFSPAAFTRMMQYGLFPAATIVMIYGFVALWRQRSVLRAGTLKSPAFVGLVTSAAMTIVGFSLGAMITVSNTLIPAHYHANIGAVTVAYMTVLLVLLPRRAGKLPWPRLATWQPLIYGAGQLTFAIGLAIAGGIGQAARKTYGADQHLHTLSAKAGLMLAGAGGLVAMIGGALFIAMATSMLLAHYRQAERPQAEPA
jgi:hypothetical protein